MPEKLDHLIVEMLIVEMLIAELTARGIPTGYVITPIHEHMTNNVFGISLNFEDAGHHYGWDVQITVYQEDSVIHFLLFGCESARTTFSHEVQFCDSDGIAKLIDIAIQHLHYRKSRQPA